MESDSKTDGTVTQSSDAELVDRVLAGDTSAYAELVERHQNAVFALLCSRIPGRGDRTALEDLAQEALLEAYSNLRSLRDPSLFRPWLVGITRNVSSRWLRKSRQETRTMDFVTHESDQSREGDAPTPLDELEKREVADAVWAAVGELPENTREAVLLHYVGGLSDREIAETVGISASAVRSRLHYGRQRLRAIMLPVAEEVLGGERRSDLFTRAVMVALPLVIPRPSTATTLLGLTTKELLMFTGGVVAIAGLVGLIWSKDASRETVEMQDSGRTVRLANPQQQASLQVALNTNATPEGDRPMSVLVDAKPSQPNLTTLVSSLHPLMQSARREEWSTARLRGVLGHAFSFEMREGGGEVYHDANLDRWLYAGRGSYQPPTEAGSYDVFPEIAQFRVFQATKYDVDVDLPALKAEARDAVLASLQQGIPALAWQPMTPEQKASGLGAGCWALIVGYDDAEETYTVRHKWLSDDFTVRFDAIGHSDPPVERFCVMIYDKPTMADEKRTHLTALRNAVAFANGRRYDPASAVYEIDANGFAAYELWREALASEEASPHHSQFHARILRARRLAAAAYLRELVTIFPEAADALETGATHYDREFEAADPLHELCDAAHQAKTFSAADRARASELVADALRADRDAVAQIEAALRILEAVE